MHRTRLFSIVLVALGITAAACSSGDDSATVETTVIDLVETSETTAPVDDETTTTEESEPAGPMAPLSGLPVDAGVDLDRPALAVKIDNHPNARPQTGLDQADIVFEARAEGVTRFLAVFHSESPSPLGPVRSSRTSDFDLLRGLSTPLYSSSGGNDYVANGLRSLPIIEVTAISQSGYFRDGSRPAPHNLFINADDLFGLASADSERPASWFSYRSNPDQLSDLATPIEGEVTIRYKGSPIVSHTWDSVRAGWLRTQDGRPHTTVSGDQLAPENVVIMVTTYVTSAADAASPELVSVGSGDLYVLTDGALVQGTWNRPTAEARPELVDEAGDEIKLTPGRTWVLYPESGQVNVPSS